jgi:hypothetical protein
MPGALISPHSLLRCRSVRVPKRVHTGFIAVAKPLSNLVGHDRPQNKPANGVGRAGFNRSAGLQVFNPAPAMECKCAQMVKARWRGVWCLTTHYNIPLVICCSEEALLGQGLARTRFEISLQAASRRFICNREIRAKNCRQVLAGGNDPALLMRCKSTPKIVRGTDVDVAAAELKKINVPQTATVFLRP